MKLYIAILLFPPSIAAAVQPVVALNDLDRSKILGTSCPRASIVWYFPKRNIESALPSLLPLNHHQ